MRRIIILWLVGIALFLISCSAENPHQDIIDLVESKVKFSDKCAVYSDGYCLKHERIKLDRWKIEEYASSYIVKARSFDDGQLSGMKIGNPVWYVKDSEVFWVNGKSKSISTAVLDQAPEDVSRYVLD